MRAWCLKFMGLLLWSLFLFVPFIARADDGFSTLLPFQINQPEVVLSQIEPAAGADMISLGEIGTNLDYSSHPKRVEGKWSVQFNAGKQTVISDDFTANINHDRIPLDDGERRSFKFGVGLNYTF